MGLDTRECDGTLALIVADNLFKMRIQRGAGAFIAHPLQCRRHAACRAVARDQGVEERSVAPIGDALVVEAFVSESGRVQDYRILSAPQGYEKAKLGSRLENILIFTVFQPARAFGRPTTGRAVLSFSRISVKG